MTSEDYKEFIMDTILNRISNEEVDMGDETCLLDCQMQSDGTINVRVMSFDYEEKSPEFKIVLTSLR